MTTTMLLLKRAAKAFLISTLAVMGSGCLPAQTTLPFVVVSPQEGQVVHPGDTIQVIVQPTAGATLSFLQLVSPIKSVTLTANAPIPVLIPSNPLGRVTLAIVAGSSAAGGGEIDRTINIEPSSQPVSLTISPSTVRLVAPNTSTVVGVTQDSIRVFGIYPDNSKLDITTSSETRFTSDNIRVAAVSIMPPGTSGTNPIYAIAPGVTSVRVNYRGLTAAATVQVNIFEKQGDLNGDGDVNEDDLNIILRALNMSATGPNDPRDLNTDGKIDALDARILTNLCSRPRCAKQ